MYPKVGSGAPGFLLVDQWGACIRVRQSAALLHDIQRALYAPFHEGGAVLETDNSYRNYVVIFVIHLGLKTDICILFHTNMEVTQKSLWPFGLLCQFLPQVELLLIIRNN